MKGCRSEHWRAGSTRIGERSVRRSASPVPPPRKPSPERVSPVLDPWKGTIDAWLEADRDAPTTRSCSRPSSTGLLLRQSSDVLVARQEELLQVPGKHEAIGEPTEPSERKDVLDLVQHHRSGALH